MIKEQNSSIKKTLFYISVYFPIIFSLSICLGIPTIAALIISAVSVLIMPDIPKKKLMPFIISFLIIGSNFKNIIPTVLISGTLLLIYSLFYEKSKRIFSEVYNSGIMLAGALTSTVLFTTYYFGIGATGDNVTEMIKAYVSLGFHPNWRGVLYGTIVLVLMVTYPRKFKSLSNYVSAPFIALIFTLILNLFLNPLDMISAITEIPSFSTESFNDIVIQIFNPEINISAVLNSIALFLLFAYTFSENKESTKKDSLIDSGANIISCGLFLLPLPYGINKNKRTVIPRIIAIIILVATFCLLKDVIERIPLHSCAVVIIVSAWENVKWSEIKYSFSGLGKIFTFISSLAIALLTDFSIGLIYSFVISIMINFIINKKIKPAD